jgi:hypothetical protein
MKFKSFFTLSLLLLIALFTVTARAAGFPANEVSLNGESNTRLGSYQIKELPPGTVNGVTMRTFELVYQNAGNKVLIYLNDQADCRDYIVRSKNLEIRYECTKSAFGAKLVTGKFRQYDPNLNANFLSMQEYGKQKMISEGNLEIPSALGLIASYYPALFARPDLLD